MARALVVDAVGRAEVVVQAADAQEQAADVPAAIVPAVEPDDDDDVRPTVQPAAMAPPTTSRWTTATSS